jgi:hypothetical protein
MGQNLFILENFDIFVLDSVALGLLQDTNISMGSLKILEISALL